MKRILAALCCICLLAAMLPVGVFATEETTLPETAVRAPGYCGENITWKYDNGTLTISGSGEMDDYPDGDAPWLEHKDNIKKIVFTGGVTRVGDGAFMDYDALEDIDFGSAMHTIGERAFKSCDKLIYVFLPASFRCFSKECFYGCKKLTELYFDGGMPSFKDSCLWEVRATMYFTEDNPWPPEYYLPLLESFQWKLSVEIGRPRPDQRPASSVTAATEAPKPMETTAPTVPETTVPETTAPETTAPVTEATLATEATTVLTTEETTEPTEKMTEPEWLNETYEEPVQEKPEKGRDLSGLWFGLFLITGTMSLILIGALVFRRRDY